MATHFSILAWRIPWTEELGRLPRVIMSQTRLKRFNTHTRPSQSGNHQSAFSLYGFTYSGYFISVESCNVCAWLLSIQFPSIAQSCRTLCDPMDCSTPGFPGASVINNLAASAGDVGLIPGSGRSPGEGNGNPLQYSCLENPMDAGSWWAIVHGVVMGQT